MGKVRDDQPLTATGDVDIGHWLERLQENVPLRDPQQMREVCELAKQLSLKAERPHKVWLPQDAGYRSWLMASCKWPLSVICSLRVRG